MNSSENHFELSLTKVNQAIQKLKTQPSKSILKKVSDTTLVYNSHSDLNNLHLRDTSFQVNLNTLINAGLVECPQMQHMLPLDDGGANNSSDSISLSGSSLCSSNESVTSIPIESNQVGIYYRIIL